LWNKLVINIVCVFVYIYIFFNPWHNIHFICLKCFRRYMRLSVVNFELNFPLREVILFTNTLRFLQWSWIIYRHLQAAILIFFFLRKSEWNKYTCKDPSEKPLLLLWSLCLYNPCPQPHHFIKKMLLTNTKSIITVVNLQMSVCSVCPV
jgi:hypothetical protein